MVNVASKLRQRAFVDDDFFTIYECIYDIGALFASLNSNSLHVLEQKIKSQGQQMIQPEALTKGETVEEAHPMELLSQEQIDEELDNDLSILEQDANKDVVERQIEEWGAEGRAVEEAEKQREGDEEEEDKDEEEEYKDEEEGHVILDDRFPRESIQRPPEDELDKDFNPNEEVWI